MATAKRMERSEDWQSELTEEDREDIKKVTDKFGKDSSFFGTMFGGLDILFVLLAFATAIKVAGGYES